MPRTLSTSQHDVLLDMLRTARARQGLTQKALADALGFRQSDISKAERGVRRLDVLEVSHWVRALGLTFIAFAQALDERLSGQEALSAQVVRAAAPDHRKSDPRK
jgi:transcriptional regulator with XRE-family HTH domain